MRARRLAERTSERGSGGRGGRRTTEAPNTVDETTRVTRSAEASLYGLVPQRSLPPPAGAVAAWRPPSLHPPPLGSESPAELKAHRGLYDALDEQEWLDTKFERSGAPSPAEGQLTVVIEYCFNSGGSISQQSTKHAEQRYHEEADLVKEYFLNYHSGAIVYVVAADFRTAKERRGVRLGAFEVDARLRVDGQLTTVNLWSKLHTSKWPKWPGWQDAVRQLIPIFEIRLRPAAMHSDGSIHYLPHAQVQVYNHDRSGLVAEQTAGADGAVVRTLRGTYTVRVPQTESENYYTEEATLTLTRVPLPRSPGPVEVLVPMRAKPRLTVMLLGEFDEQGALNLPFCSASMHDVQLTLTDRSAGTHEGDRIFTGRASAMEAYDSGEAGARGGRMLIDLSSFADRIPAGEADLSERLWQLAANEHEAAQRHAGGDVDLATFYDPASGQASQMESFLGQTTSEGGVPASADPASGWLVEVEASLPDFPAVPIDARLCSMSTSIGRGGAADVVLRLTRATREVAVRVGASEAFASPWAAMLSMADVAIEIYHARGSGDSTAGQLVQRAYAISQSSRPSDNALSDILGGGAGATQAPRYAEVLLPVELAVNESYVVSIVQGDADAVQAMPLLPTSLNFTVLAGAGSQLVQMYASRVTADVKIRWSAASLSPSHWSNGLRLPDGFTFSIRHKASGARVHHETFHHSSQQSLGATPTASARGTTAPPSGRALAESFVNGAGSLFVGETYVVEVNRSSGVLPAQASFSVSSHLPKVLDMVLRRATAGVTVRIRCTAGGESHWSTTIGLPPGIGFKIFHPADKSHPIASGHADHQGQCVVPAQDALFVGESYKLRVEASSATEGSEMDFVLTDDTHGQEVGMCNVDMNVKRTSVAVRVHLQAVESLAAGHWSHEQLAAPAYVPLRIVHAATKGFLCEVTTDNSGVATIEEIHGLYINETYTIEVPDTKFVRQKAVDFTAELRRGPLDGMGGQAAAPQQVVTIPVERQTNDITLKVVVAFKSSALESSARLAAPSGLRYTVFHKRLQREVASGHTDQVGKAVVKRKGTLFVGEEYVVRTAPAAGMAAAEQSFVVDEGTWDRPKEVVVHVERQNQTLKFKLLPALAETLHWAKDMPLPETLPFEIIHLETKQRIHKGQCPTGVEVPVAGDSVGLYVGETYRLRVPHGDFVDEASRDFTPTKDENCEVILRVQHAFATVSITLRSVHADTEHWAARLPLPPNLPMRLVHHETNRFVCAGTSDERSLVEFPASGCKVVVGEKYRVIVDQTDKCVSADAAVFIPSSRNLEVASRVQRIAGKVTVGASYAKNGTGHWSSALVLPDGIAFNVYHKSLGAIVESGATRADEQDTCRLYSVARDVGAGVRDATNEALFVGETYILEVPPSVSLKPASREFTVNSEEQIVEIKLERKVGRILVSASAISLRSPSVL